MKNKIFLFALAFILSCFTVSSTQAAEANMTKAQTQARIMEIKQRVEEIKTMDLKHMDKVERKDLKQELKGMNKELRTLDPGYIYISTGALIIIIILLILLL